MKQLINHPKLQDFLKSINVLLSRKNLDNVTYENIFKIDTPFCYHQFEIFTKQNGINVSALVTYAHRFSSYSFEQLDWSNEENLSIVIFDHATTQLENLEEAKNQMQKENSEISAQIKNFP